MSDSTKKYIMAGVILFLAIASVFIIILAAVIIGDRTGAGSGRGMIGEGRGNMNYPASADPVQIGNCLDEYMKGAVPTSPLIGYGETFALAGQSSNVNPALMVAIGQQESALGTAGIVKDHPYNYYGLTKAGGGWEEFSSWEEAISNQARYLNENYLSQGLTTIPQIGAKYAPVGAGNDPNNLNSNWVNGVQSHFDAISNQCPNLVQEPTLSGKCGLTSVNVENVKFYNADARLMPGAATDFTKLAKDYQKNILISDMFRSKEDQIRICGGVKADGRCTNPKANPPGTSMHEAGLAFDVSWRQMSVSDYNQLVSVASQHHWAVSRTTGYGTYESWHFDYTGFQPEFWYGKPNITNAINAANGQCST